MKQISTILLTLAALWLSGCSVEELEQNNGNPLPGGVTRLSAAIAMGAQTRAVGDKLTDATDNEKRIDRLAFVVHTEAEGMQVYPPLKAGEDEKLFPNKVKLTSNGDGSYSATVDLTAGAGYDADIVALANLPEDYDYNQIITWGGLLDSVTVSTQVMPTVTDLAGGKAFVMQGNTTVALHKEKEEKFSLVMERLVARIDITNMAYSGEADKGFQLTSARVLRAMPVSYLYPHDLYASPDTVTVTHPSWSFDDTAVKYYMGEVEDANDKTADVTGGTPAAADRQAVWHNLYTYENSDTQHAPTAIEVTGTFRGKPVTRQIPFEVLQADGLTRKAVPIVRNHRYLVLIKPAPGLTDIAYEVKVDDWNAVDTINVQPDQTLLPVFTTYECTEATKTYGIIPDTKPMPDTIVVPAAGATITFTASCPFDTRVTFGYASAEDGNGWLTATATDPVLVPTTKAATEPTYEREYTVTVSANTLDATLVNRGYIYVANGGNGSAVDTITVYQGADIAYGETRFAAVTLGSLNGQELVWAPINVGATEIATDMKESDYGTDAVVSYSEDLIAKCFPQCGYFYQWGRNVPFKFGTNVEGGYLSGTGLPTYAEACQNTGTYANTYIYIGFYWFKDYSSSAADGLSPLLTDKKWPREYQPCPAGWHVPSKEEWGELVKQTSTTVNGVCIYGGKLSIPKAGYLTGATWVGIQYSFYWLSDYGDRYPYSCNLPTTIDSSTYGAGCGLPIRCIKD